MAEEGAQMDENQNQAQLTIFHRLASFPLVQSAYQIASFAYGDVKNVHPAVGYVCDLSERGAKAAADLAAIGVTPILKVMEPQVTAANNFALQLVDDLEVKLPILERPADEVVSDVVDGVRAVKDRALDRMQNVLERTQAVARESYQVFSSATTLVGSEVRDMVKVTAYFMVAQAEELVDRYLPEESDRGPESSSSSDEIDEMDEARFSLVYRSRKVVISIVTRSWKRLRMFMERYWDFLQSIAGLLLSIPLQVRLCAQAVLWSVFPQIIYKDEAEQRAMARKKKAKAQSRSGRLLGKEHLNFPQSSVFLVSPSGRHVAYETERGRIRAREKRRQSLDSYPSRIQEDVVFYS